MNSFSIWWNHSVAVLHLPIHFSLSSEKCWNGQKVHIDAKCINILFIIWSLLFYVYMEKNILTLMAGWRGVLLRREGGTVVENILCTHSNFCSRCFLLLTSYYSRSIGVFFCPNVSIEIYCRSTLIWTSLSHTHSHSYLYLNLFANVSCGGSVLMVGNNVNVVNSIQKQVRRCQLRMNTLSVTSNNNYIFVYLRLKKRLKFTKILKI